MTQLILIAWSEGFKTLSFVKLQMEVLHMPLFDAKSNLDLLLSGGLVTIKIDDSIIASTFKKEAEAIGIVFQ